MPNALYPTSQQKTARKAVSNTPSSGRAIAPPTYGVAGIGSPIQRVDAPSFSPRPVAPNRTGLPDRFKAGIESLSGYSMDDVKVHYNSSKPANVGALAYAQGNQIHLGPGQERHLPHEAWHVVQQKQGRVRATLQLKNGVQLNDEHVFEKEAESMGCKVKNLQAHVQKPSNPLLIRHAGFSAMKTRGIPITQRVENDSIEERHLEMGDVLIKKALFDTWGHGAINIGQGLLSHNRGGHANSVHAAMYAGRGMITESGTSGLKKANLSEEANSKWLVFRFHKKIIAERAVRYSKGAIYRQEVRPKFGKYSRKKAFGSLIHSSKRTPRTAYSESHRSPEFYCSNFVVRSYAVAAHWESKRSYSKIHPLPINVDQRYISPKKLEAVLKKSSRWTFVGVHKP